MRLKCLSSHLIKSSILIRFLMKDHLDRVEKNRLEYHIMSGVIGCFYLKIPGYQ